MERFLVVCKTLKLADIGFSVHYPTNSSTVIEITPPLNNEQLKIAVSEGGILEHTGIVRILFIGEES